MLLLALHFPLHLMLIFFFFEAMTLVSALSTQTHPSGRIETTVVLLPEVVNNNDQNTR